MEPDFSGYVTKADLVCSDGLVIKPDAFKHQDKMTVPLVWGHGHDDIEHTLGHMVLENRPDGVYGYGYFNDSPKGKHAKTVVQHKDITKMSIYANHLKKAANAVIHGMIREVSLVIAGANPGALIDFVAVRHSDGDIEVMEDEAIIHTGLDFELTHTDTSSKTADDDSDEETAQQVYDSLNPEQLQLVHFMIGKALESADSASHSDDDDEEDEEDSNNEDLNHKEGEEDMPRNVFDQSKKKSADTEGYSLTHDDIAGIVTSAKKNGSMKEAVEEFAIAHGINTIDILFPDAKVLGDGTPTWVSRRMDWVDGVLNGVSHSPFSRVKTRTADITMEEARAKGYIKANMKKEEFFNVAQRTTSPTTVYKKQKLDRDDIIDITDFDVVVWMKAEMRVMLDEEIARAILIGDGRDVDDEDKVKDPQGQVDGVGIRSIYHDDEFYVSEINVNIGDANSSYQEVIDQVLLGMRFYKGSGSPTFYTTLAVQTQMLLLKDTLGRRLYTTVADVAAAMGVGSIVAVEAMEPVSASDGLLGIIVNLNDYNVGADQGGEINLFDFFDIDYNQNKYLIETRISGALTKPKSALKVMSVASGDVLVTPVAPTQSGNTISGINQDHVTYTVTDSTGATVTVTSGAATIASADVSPVTVVAAPASGYYFADDQENTWSYEYQD